jgi:hypothetical protein
LPLFESCAKTLPHALRSTLGGQNVIAAGLEADIDFAARLDALDVVAAVDPITLTVTRANRV